MEPVRRSGFPFPPSALGIFQRITLLLLNFALTVVTHAQTLADAATQKTPRILGKQESLCAVVKKKETRNQ